MRPTRSDLLLLLAAALLSLSLPFLIDQSARAHARATCVTDAECAAAYGVDLDGTPIRSR
jgi:hypothetical protein